MLASYNTISPTNYHRGGALTIPDLSLYHEGGRVLFNSTNNGIVLQHGTVTGLVGTNGAGKSSLARILASKTLPNFPQSIVVEYLAASDDEEYCSTRRHSSTLDGHDGGDCNSSTLHLKPIEYIQLRIRQRSDKLLDDIAELEAKLEGNEEESANSLEDIANQLSELYEVEEALKERVQREMHHALDELGLDQYAERPLCHLSSGWRYKARLVAAFLTHPDFLIIDEPSFLDDASMKWFVSRTLNTAKTDNAIVLLISHKEALLDSLCDNIIYINSGNQTLSMYHCGYNTFRSTHQEQVQSAAKTISETESKQEAAEKSLKTLQTKLKGREKNLKEITTKNADKRFIKGKNKEAKQKADKSAASKLKQTKKQVAGLEQARRMKRTERVTPIHIDGASSGDGTIVSLQDTAVAYDDCIVFENVDAVIDATDKILLCGSNGCGKSTLVKTILGEIEPSHGHITRMGNFMYFPQTALSDLLQHHGNTTAVGFLGDKMTETTARCHLGNFGLARNLALQPINTLSAGQRVRLWLAKENLLHPKPCLLVVDEISENVDRETRDSLVHLLSTFEGAVLVISHDPDFRGTFQPTKVWELRRYGMLETYPD